MSRALFAVVLAFPLIALANPHYRPDVEVNVPPEVFSSGGQSAQPCTQCCVYQDQNYSEEALQYPLAPADIPLLEAFMALRAARPAPDVHVPVTSRGSRVRARHEDG